MESRASKTNPPEAKKSSLLSSFTESLGVLGSWDPGNVREYSVVFSLSPLPSFFLSRPDPPFQFHQASILIETFSLASLLVLSDVPSQHFIPHNNSIGINGGARSVTSDNYHNSKIQITAASLKSF